MIIALCMILSVGVFASGEPSGSGEPSAEAGGIVGTYPNGEYTLLITEDLTFTMEKAGQNLEGEEFVLTVTGSVTENADGTFTVSPSSEVISGVSAEPASDEASSKEPASDEAAPAGINPAAYSADWAGYQAYCVDSLADSENQEVAQMAIAEITAFAEADYTDDAMPFSMLIEFGEFVTFGDFLAAH